MHPVLIQITDSFFIGTYGVLIALGLFLGITMAAWRGKRRGIAPDVFFDLAFVAVLSGFFAARLFYIGLEWDQFMADPRGVLFSRTGFVFLGGFIGGVGATIWWMRRRKLPVLAIGDVAVASLALAHGFGRIGCHFAGCCFGGACEVPWLAIKVPAVEMRDGTLWGNAFAEQAYAGDLLHGATHSHAIWPVQLMEAGALFVLVAILVWFATKPRRPGQSLALYLALYALLRFGIEFLRGDSARGLWFGDRISTSQLISLAMLPVALGLWWWSRSQPIAPHSHPSTAPPLPEAEDTPAARRAKRRTAGSAPPNAAP